MRAFSSIFLVSSTLSLLGSSTASMRLITHIGSITSGYLPRLKRSRKTSSAMPQMKETILLWVVRSILRRLQVAGRVYRYSGIESGKGGGESEWRSPDIKSPVVERLFGQQPDDAIGPLGDKKHSS